METKLILKDALNGNFTIEIRDNPDKQKTFLSVDLKYKNKDHGEDEEVMDFYINKHDLTQLINHLTEIRDGNSQQTKSSGSDILVEEDI